jgi:aminopeptidase C
MVLIQNYPTLSRKNEKKNYLMEQNIQKIDDPCQNESRNLKQRFCK